jgi:hypothetical protein
MVKVAKETSARANAAEVGGQGTTDVVTSAAPVCGDGGSADARPSPGHSRSLRTLLAHLLKNHADLAVAEVDLPAEVVSEAPARRSDVDSSTVAAALATTTTATEATTLASLSLRRPSSR